MSKNKIGERIKVVRKALRMTQEEFGTNIGVKGNTITGYERGTRSPSDAVINNLCRTFKVNQTWLRTGDGEMDLIDLETAGAIDRLCFDYNCNPLERKFLDGYFSLEETERDAFCGLLSKMFPSAIEAIAGPDSLSRPLAGFQEVEPLNDAVDVVSLLQKSPGDMSDDEISAVSAELEREMLEEKEAAEKSSLSSGTTGSSGAKMA